VRAGENRFQQPSQRVQLISTTGFQNHRFSQKPAEILPVVLKNRFIKGQVAGYSDPGEPVVWSCRRQATAPLFLLLLRLVLQRPRPPGCESMLVSGRWAATAATEASRRRKEEKRARMKTLLVLGLLGLQTAVLAAGAAASDAPEDQSEEGAFGTGSDAAGHPPRGRWARLEAAPTAAIWGNIDFCEALGPDFGPLARNFAFVEDGFIFEST